MKENDKPTIGEGPDGTWNVLVPSDKTEAFSEHLRKKGIPAGIGFQVLEANEFTGEPAVDNFQFPGKSESEVQSIVDEFFGVD